MIQIGNISSHVQSRMSKNYGYLFHPLASTGRDVRQTNALTHIDPESKRQQEAGENPDGQQEYHGQKGQDLTPGAAKSFTDFFRSTQPKQPDFSPTSGGAEQMTSNVRERTNFFKPSPAKNPTAPKA